MQTDRAERHREALQALLDAGPGLSLERDRRGREGLQAAPRRRARAFAASPSAERRGAPARARRGRDGRARRDPRRHALRARAPRRPRDRARRRLGALQLRGRDRRPRRPHHARGARRGPPVEHAQAAARARGGQSGRPRRRGAAAAVRAPAAAARPRRQEALKAPRRGLRAASCARPATCPAAVRNYLALLGWGAGDDQTVLSTPGADRALHAASGQPQPGALRRGQAELAERRLHPRAARRRSWSSASAVPRCRSPCGISR